MKPEWLSAHLDGELTAAEAAEVEAALHTDPALRAEYEAVAAVRATLRAAAVEVPADALDRIADAVAEAPDVAPVIALDRRRRVPLTAAAAAAVVIIASVVSGVGGTAVAPALGDLVARHEAAAAEHPDFMADAEEMPMDDAVGMGPAMPADYVMQHVFVDGSTLHFVYLSAAGAPISIFRQDGEADLDGLPEGKMVEGDTHDMWSATQGANHVAVVEGTGFTWTIVAPEPHDTMMVAMMDDLPARDPSLADRARDAADAVVEPFRFWD